MPKPCAGNAGTSIVVEDLFYNTPTRRNALKNHTEEYNRILDVVQKYAIRYFNVSFSCKHSSGNNDLHTTASSSSREVIKIIYGTRVEQCLIDLNHVGEDNYTISGYISNANTHLKKKEFIMFINSING
jgi:DNA mismatch repair protein MLH1